MAYLLVEAGGGRIEDLTLSESSVRRWREESRKDSSLKVALAEYDPILTVHFDGKRVKMGPCQGGQVLEHIVVSVTGISGDHNLGINVAPNSSGKTKKQTIVSLIKFGFCRFEYFILVFI